MHSATGLARATLLRLLKTLEDRNWVAYAHEDSTYRLRSHAHRQSVSVSPQGEIAELATPILDHLCKRILWPSGVAVRDGHTMLILQTKQNASPFTVDRTIIGHRPSLLKSATGRAYLAFCPRAERERLLRALRQSGHPDDNLAHVPKLVDRILDDTRRNGYGVREFARRTRLSDTEASFNAIAVPVMTHGRVIACINTLWIENVMSVKSFATAYLPVLRGAANDLAGLLARAPLPDVRMCPRKAYSLIAASYTARHSSAANQHLRVHLRQHATAHSRYFITTSGQSAF